MVWNRLENRVYYDSNYCFDTLHAMKSNSLRDNCMHDDQLGHEAVTAGTLCTSLYILGMAIQTLAQYSGVETTTMIRHFSGLCESDARALQGRQRSPPVLPLPTQQLPPRVCSCIRHCAVGHLGRRLLLQRLGVPI